MLEQRIRAAQRNEHEAVVLREDAALEILPEIAHGLHAFFVRCAEGEAPLHLAHEPRIRRTCARGDNEEVVRVEAEMLGLEMDFGDAGIGQDWRMLRTRNCASVVLHSVWNLSGCSRE